jgi:hypothetical protein
MYSPSFKRKLETIPSVFDRRGVCHSSLLFQLLFPNCPSGVWGVAVLNSSLQMCAKNLQFVTTISLRIVAASLLTFRLSFLHVWVYNLCGWKVSLHAPKSEPLKCSQCCVALHRHPQKYFIQAWVADKTADMEDFDKFENSSGIEASSA